MARSVWKGPFVHPSLLKKIDKLKNEFSKQTLLESGLFYLDEKKKIYWRSVGTTKKQQYFEILNNDKVNHFDGIKTKTLYRF